MSLCRAMLRHQCRDIRTASSDVVDNVYHSVLICNLHLTLETPWMVVSAIIIYVDLSSSSRGCRTIGMPRQAFRPLVRMQALSLMVLRFRWDGTSLFNF